MPSDSFSGSQSAGRSDAKATVKWFNPTKGFGFVTIDDKGTDAFCHRSVVEAAGYDTLLEGARVVCDLSQGPKGMQVDAIHSIDTSTATQPSHSAREHRGPRSGGFNRRDAAPRQHGHGDASVELTGAVKFYNGSKGFGFIAPDTGGKDVFVHANVLSRSGIDSLDEGQRVRITVSEGNKGPQADHVELI